MTVSNVLTGVGAVVGGIALLVVLFIVGDIVKEEVFDPFRHHPTYRGATAVTIFFAGIQLGLLVVGNHVTEMPGWVEFVAGILITLFGATVFLHTAMWNDDEFDLIGGEMDS